MSQPGSAGIFWGEISPSEHFVHIYENDQSCLDILEGYIGGGLRIGEAAIVIATPDHVDAITHRLEENGFDLDAAKAEDRFIALDAEETLSRFMVNGWPNDDKFKAVIYEVINRARGKNGRTVRAFGEMVALLWARGHSAATVRLEHLWHALYKVQDFSLFCAYPKAGFTKDAADSIKEICDAHSKVYDQRH